MAIDDEGDEPVDGRDGKEAREARSAGKNANRPSRPEPVVVTRAHDIVRWLHERSTRFPRHYRFGLADKMQQESLALLTALVDASYRRERKVVLQDANLALTRLRVLIRLAHDVRLVLVQAEAKQRANLSAAIAHLREAFGAIVEDHHIIHVTHERADLEAVCEVMIERRQVQIRPPLRREVSDGQPDRTQDREEIVACETEPCTLEGTVVVDEQIGEPAQPVLVCADVASDHRAQDFVVHGWKEFSRVELEAILVAARKISRPGDSGTRSAAADARERLRDERTQEARLKRAEEQVLNDALSKRKSSDRAALGLLNAEHCVWRRPVSTRADLVEQSEKLRLAGDLETRHSWPTALAPSRAAVGPVQRLKGYIAVEVA